MPRTRHKYIHTDMTLAIIDRDFPYQFNLRLIAQLFTVSVQFLKKMFSKFNFQKLAGLWLVGKVVNHIGMYGSRAAEGLSASQRRSCLSVGIRSDIDDLCSQYCTSRCHVKGWGEGISDMMVSKFPGYLTSHTCKLSYWKKRHVLMQSRYYLIFQY